MVGQSLVSGVGKSISELIQIEVKKSKGSIQNKLMVLTQQVDLMNTNFEECKRTGNALVLVRGPGNAWLYLKIF